MLVLKKELPVMMMKMIVLLAENLKGCSKLCVRTAHNQQTKRHQSLNKPCSRVNHDYYYTREPCDVDRSDGKVEKEKKTYLGKPPLSGNTQKLFHFIRTPSLCQ